MQPDRTKKDKGYTMLNESGLLPVWFTSRMMNDEWSFGLLMITGDIIALQSISGVVQDATGNLWIEATLTNAEEFMVPDNVNGHRVFTSPTKRQSITINASHVVAAFELADT